MLDFLVSLFAWNLAESAIEDFLIRSILQGDLPLVIVENGASSYFPYFTFQ
jgi:hypothetical protein